MLDAAGEALIAEIMRRPYRLVIRGEPVEGYLAEAPEFPGCFTAGESPQEALANLQEAMAAWLESKIAHGELFPEPEGWAVGRRAG